MHVAEVPAGYLMTWRDWAARATEHRHSELINGEFYMAPAPTVQHQELTGRIYRALQDFFDEAGGGRTFIAPLGVRLGELDVVEPDVFVVLDGGTARIDEDMVVGPPALVIEVLSPGSARHDLVDKADLYWRSGVREYWVIDPRGKAVTQLTRGKSKWKSSKVASQLSSPLLPGFELALKSLFR